MSENKNIRNEPYGLYKILELDRNATEKDIKKQYRKLAMKWHPDKNINNKEEATKKFQDVSYAYEILSDSNKKSMYDRFGLTDDASSGGFSNFTNNGMGTDPFTLFEQFFGSSKFMNSMSRNPNIHSSFTFTTKPQQPKPNIKGKSVEYDLQCTLEELHNGCEKKVSITRKVYDSSEKEIIRIFIKRGWKEGTKITFENKGDKLPNIIPGDIIFTIKERKHQIFTRDNFDLIMYKTISLDQALNGFQLNVIDINKTPITKWVKPLKKSNDFEIFNNRGMIMTKGRGYGNLIVRYIIVF